MARMKRIALTDRDGTPRNPQCRGGRCPAVYEVSDGDFVIQGFVVPDSDRTSLDIPDDEDVIRIPRTLLEQLKGKI